MSRGESSFVAIEIAGRATLSVDLVKGAGLRTPRIDTGDEWVTVGLGDPVQDSVQVAYEAMFDLLTREQGLDDMDAYVVMSALAHTELGGPDGQRRPRPAAPLPAGRRGDPRPVGQGGAHRLSAVAHGRWRRRGSGAATGGPRRWGAPRLPPGPPAWAWRARSCAARTGWGCWSGGRRTLLRPGPVPPSTSGARRGHAGGVDQSTSVTCPSPTWTTAVVPESGSTSR